MCYSFAMLYGILKDVRQMRGCLCRAWVLYLCIYVTVSLFFLSVFILGP